MSEASVHSADPVLDLAVLFISASDLPYVALGDSDTLRNGQGVNALGFPLAEHWKSAVSLPPTSCRRSARRKAASRRCAGMTPACAARCRSTASSIPGTAAVLLFDERGYAVGVVRARVKGDAGIAFAIPINQAKDFLESRGLDSLMPARRLRLGALQSSRKKGPRSATARGYERCVAVSLTRGKRPGVDRRCTAHRSGRLAMDGDATRAHLAADRGIRASLDRGTSKPECLASRRRSLTCRTCDRDGSRQRLGDRDAVRHPRPG